MASADFTVNASACPPEKAVAYGATVTLALLSTAFNTAAWSIVGSDRPSTPTPTITPGGSPLGATATFTMVADPGTGLGAALLVQCVINGGRDAAGQVDSTLTKRAIVGVNNSGGNVPFVVGETSERNATHGYTALLNQALVATGSPGSAGVGLVGAVDAIATSNVSQSGTTAVDGVTLTANVSRVLCVGQTTTSQNGVKLVQAGAWTNPSDFSTDAQVQASVGAPIYVKAGGLSGGNTNWQLASGTTIAGAKVYQQIRNGAGLAPVRAIQTAAFPGTYSAGTWTATATGALSTSIFDGLTIAIGESVEISQGTLAVPAAHIGNGIFTRVADTASKPTFTRRPDLDSSADFASGVAYEVTDGLSGNKGSRRQLITTGAITLGATPLEFGAVRPPAQIIDLSQPPYNIRDMSFPEWQDAGYPDFFRAIHQFLYDYRDPNVASAVGLLPSGNGGKIFGWDPFRHYGGGATLRGAGRDASTIVPFWLWGSFACDMQELGAMPAIGPVIDSAPNATSLSCYLDEDGAPRPFFFNLTDEGVLVDGWSQFEFRALVQFDEISGHLPQSHITSIGGMRTNVDTIDSQNPCFTLWLREELSPVKIAATLRTTDTTAGVYGATVHTGGGAGTIVGDATIKPTQDAADFTIKIHTGGTVGVAGIKIQWAIDGNRFCAPVALGTATTKTILREVNAQGQPFSAKVVLSGALVAGDTYKIPCSGVNQAITITSDTPIDVDTPYDILVQYRGGKVYLYISEIGGAIDTGSGTVGVSQTGVVKQYPWESWIVGTQMNAEVNESTYHFFSASMSIGSLRIKSSDVTAPSPVTTLSSASGITGQVYHVVPSTTDVRYDPAGLRRERYRAYPTPDGRYTWFTPRSNDCAIVGGGGIEDLTFDLGSQAWEKGSAIRSCGWRNHTFRNLAFRGGMHCWSGIGPDWGSINEDILWASRWGACIKTFKCNLVLGGYHEFADAGAPVHAIISFAGILAPNLMFHNMESGARPTQACMYLDHIAGGRMMWSCDAENQIGAQCGREMIRVCVEDSSVLEIVGDAYTLETLAVVTQVGGGVFTGRVLINIAVISGGVTDETMGYALSGCHSPFSTVNGAPPFIVGDRYKYTGPAAFPVPDCDTAGKWEKHGVAGVSLLADSDATLTWARGSTFKATAATWTANRTLTLGVSTSMQVGDKFEFLIEAQPSYTTAIVNGGPAGGTITTVPAATDRTMCFRLDETFNLVRVA